MKPIPVQALYQPVHKPSRAVKQVNHQANRFNTVLKDKLFENLPVHLSKHAKERIADRNIQLTQNKWQKIHEKMQEAKQKGLTDSLVLTNEAALVVNVSSNTVITALDRTEASSHIFTNISGTILVDG